MVYLPFSLAFLLFKQKECIKQSSIDSMLTGNTSVIITQCNLITNKTTDLHFLYNHYVSMVPAFKPLSSLRALKCLAGNRK